MDASELAFQVKRKSAASRGAESVSPPQSGKKDQTGLSLHEGMLHRAVLNVGVSLSRSLHDELEAETVRIRPDHPSLDDYVFSGFVGKPQGDDLPNAKSFAGLDENP